VSVPSVKEIELRPCLYVVRCAIHACPARATIIARYVDANGSTIRQYELCATHADQIAQRERARGRRIVNL
jgi:hypothetical protein